MPSPLQIYFDNIAAIHGVSALFAKLTLALVLGAVAGGNRRPGQKLLTVCFAALLSISAYIAFDFAFSGDFGGEVSRAAGVCGGVALLAGIGTAASLFAGGGEWRTSNSSGWKQALAWPLVVLAFWFPFCGQGLLRALFFSPLGALPHAALLAACAVAWLGMPATNRIAAASLGLGAFVLGGHALLAGVPAAGALLLLAAALVGWELLRASRESPAEAPRVPLRESPPTPLPTYRDEEPAPKARPAKPAPKPLPREEPRRDGRKWKLK